MEKHNIIHSVTRARSERSLCTAAATSKTVAGTHSLSCPQLSEFLLLWMHALRDGYWSSVSPWAIPTI